MSFLSFSVFQIVALCVVFSAQGSGLTEKRLSQLETIIMTQQKELNNFRAETDQLTSKLKDLRAEKNEEIKLLKSELDDIRAEKYEEIKLLKSEFDDIRAEKNEEIKLLKSELDNIRAEKNEEIKLLKREFDDIRAEKNEEIKLLKSELDHIRAEKNGEIKLLKSELDNIRAEKNEEIKLLKSEFDDIRVEMNEEIKHLKCKLDDIQAEKTEEIDHLKKRLDMLEAAAPKNTEKEYVDEVTDIGNVNDTAKLRQRRFQSPTNVAFYVYFSYHTQYNKHETLVFNVEETDIGNNYNVNDGIFDVPVTGTYVFTVTVGCIHNGFVTAEIIVNGQVKGTVFANSEHIHDDHSASATIVVHANAGDHVFVRKGATSDNHLILSDGTYTRTAFCGWLLF